MGAIVDVIEHSAVEFKFSRERVTAELCEEIIPLLTKHHIEVSHFDDLELRPDFDSYCSVDAAGFTRVFTIRIAGLLVGYCLFFVKKSFHFVDSLQAVQDILFIDPSHRGIGCEFVSWCDEQLKAEGVEIVYQALKVWDDKFGAKLLSMGYEVVDIVYGKRL
jgi:hypothetical protein